MRYRTKSTTAARRFAQESTAQVAAVEAALRAAALNLEFTRVTSPISGRVGRAIVTEGNLVSSGPPEATLLTTGGLARSRLRVLRCRRAGLPQSTRPGGSRSRGSINRHVQMALANEEGYPHDGQLDFLDNQLDSGTGTIRGRAVFSNSNGLLTPWPVRPPALDRRRQVSRPADSGPRRGDGFEQEVRLRRLAGEPGRVPPGDAGSDRRGPACGAKRA
jgi:multidrug efflux pump subunit AcrA (membrane-fusion protein)